jgi:hypothetical protein
MAIKKNRPNMLFFAKEDILQFREELGVSQKILGIMIGANVDGLNVSKSYISKLESGDAPISENIRLGLLALQKKHMKKVDEVFQVGAIRRKIIGHVRRGSGNEKAVIDFCDPPITSPVAHLKDGEMMYHSYNGGGGTNHKTVSARIPVLRMENAFLVLKVRD